MQGDPAVESTATQACVYERNAGRWRDADKQQADESTVHYENPALEHSVVTRKLADLL